MLGYLSVLLPAAGVTVGITLASIVGASVVGIVVAAMRLSNVRVLQLVASTYIELFRNTPTLVQVFYIFYVLPSIFPWKLAPWPAGVIVLTLHFGTHLAEIFRAGILGVDRSQREAAEALNLSPILTFLHVILPQAIRNVLPAWGNIFVGLFKATAILSIITVNELMFQARVLGSLSFRYFEVYTLTTLIYLAIGYPSILGIGWLEKRLIVGSRGRVWTAVERDALMSAGR